jgi:hypothetical protein
LGKDTLAALGALRIDEEKLKGHVDEVVRLSIEETLNALLDAEADAICRAHPTRPGLDALAAAPASLPAMRPA